MPPTAPGAATAAPSTTRLELGCTICGQLATVAHVPEPPAHLKPMIGVALRMLSGNVTLHPGVIDPHQVSAILNLECASCARGARTFGGTPAQLVNAEGISADSSRVTVI